VDSSKNISSLSKIPDETRPKTDGVSLQERGILGALVYADIFDYPLTEEEIYSYSVACPVSCEEVRLSLQQSSWLAGRLEKRDPFWFLTGRSHLVERRRQREGIARCLWTRAQRYVVRIASLPFVRMLAVTGSMAMKNVSSLADDIDVLIVAENRRVFLTRSLAALISRLARRSGVSLCPNFVVAKSNLRLSDESLFTAHELAQLIPVSGRAMYLRLWDSNRWMESYLPNAAPRLHALLDGRGSLLLHRRMIEAILRGEAGHVLDRWEKRRKLARLGTRLRESAGAGIRFSADVFKAHFVDHQDEALRQYAARLLELGISDPDKFYPVPLIRHDGM